MKIRVRTVLVAALAAVVLLAVVGLSFVGWQVILGPRARAASTRRFEVTDARLARGKYLVEGPAHCFHCHTEHDLSVPELPIVQAKKGAGWQLPIPELNNIAARNITPDVETGIGSWTDDEIARAIREGIRKDGTALFPVMPYPDFAMLDDADVESIVVYLRTIPAVRNVLPPRQLPFPLEYIAKTIPKPLAVPQPSHPSATPVERGAYLVRIAGCQGCHTPTQDGNAIPGLAFGGGEPFAMPSGTIHSANITRDASGIAHYDAALFKDMMHTGHIGGRLVSHVMPLEFFRNMTDNDLDDVFTFLGTQPPVKHRVSNTDPPAPCPLCKQSHGLGELNR